MTLSLSSCLHYWSSRYGSVPVVGGNPVHSRNSAGSWIDQAGRLQSAIVNTPRFETADLGDGAGRRAVMRLEQARTNVLTAAISSWSLDGLTVVTGKPDPFGKTGAIDMTWASGNGRQYTTVTYTGDGTKAFAIPVRAGTAASSAVVLFDMTTSSTIGQVNIAWAGGVPTPSIVGGAGTIFSTIALAGGWYLLLFAINGFTAAHGNRIEVWADLSATSKSMQFYTPNIENAATPSALFGDVGITRAADSFYWDYTPGPQDAAFYTRFIERGTINDVAGGRVFEIGNSADGDPRFLVYRTGGTYAVFHANGSGNVSESLAVAPVYGDTVELVAFLLSTGAVLLVQSINGAAVTATTQSGALTLASAWADTKLWLNGGGGIPVGINDFAEFKIVKHGDMAASTNADAMAELRAFELDSRGAVL